MGVRAAARRQRSRHPVRLPHAGCGRLRTGGRLSTLGVASQLRRRASTCTIDDLLPATAYVVLVRERLRGYSTAPTRARLCRTLSSARQPQAAVARDVCLGQRERDLVEVVAADASAFTGHVALQYRRSGTAAWTDYPNPSPTPRATVWTGAPPNTTTTAATSGGARTDTVGNGDARPRWPAAVDAV